MPREGLLVLGATGFVGKRLLDRLQTRYPEIYAIARSADELQWNNTVHAYSASIDNQELLKKILPQCKTVIHLASDSTPGSSALQPSLEATVNLLPSLRFLEYLQDYDHISLIYLSSGGTVYGTQASDLVAEDVALSPISYYGAGKASLEKFILAYCSQTQGAATILRPSNFYGPGQPYRRGFGVVPTIFRHILTGETMQIWGDGKTIRNYLYIDDFVDLCVKLIDNTEKGVKIYNVGSAVETTLNELCESIENATNMPVKRQYQAARQVDVKRIVLDCTRIREVHGWTPRTNLHDGLKNAWKWFKNQYN